MDSHVDWASLDVLAPRERGLRTLEVRWIRAGALPDVLAESLMPAPAEIEIREDRYLVAPLLRQIGVKIRGGVQLDVKVYRGSPGDLRIDGVICGELQSWRKWSLPVGIDDLSPDVDDSWVAVKKLRRKRSFAVVDGCVVERPRSPETDGCTVELTQVTVHGGLWWTLGFEAGGPGRLLERELTATAAFLLPPPGGGRASLDRSDSMSYVTWLATAIAGPPGRPRGAGRPRRSR